MIAGQDLVVVFDLTDIEAIPQQIEQRATAEENAATGRACCQQSGFGADVPLAEVSHQCIDAAEVEIALEDQPDPFGLVLDNGNLAVFHLIAKGEGTSDPQTFPFRSGDLVPDALGSDLPLELSEGQQDVER
jgi:hypothetical protein